MAIALLNAVNFLNNFSRPTIWSRNHCFIDLRADADWQDYDRYYLEIVLQVTDTAPGPMPAGITDHPQPNYTLTASPDNDGVVRFEYARILNDYPLTHLPCPEFGEDTCGLWRLPEWELSIYKNIDGVRTQVMQGEIPSLNFEGKYIFNVLGAGLDRESFAYLSQDNWLYTFQKQLTSAADPKMSHSKAEEFLYYYPAFANLTSVNVMVTLHRPDGTEDTFTLFAAQDCYPPCVFFAPTSFKNIVSILNDNNFAAWDIWFESAAAPITGRVSELFRYELPDQPCREPRIFYSKNSLGGWDTTVFLGDNQNTIISDFQTAHIFENYDYALKDFQRKTFAQRGVRNGEAFTHWLNKRQADALQDFAISKAIILQDTDREILTPVAAENISFDYRFKEQNLVGFQFAYSHANRVPLYTRFVKRPEDTVVEPPPAVLAGVGLFIVHHTPPMRVEVVARIPFGVLSVFAFNGFAGQSTSAEYYFQLIAAAGDADPLNPAFGSAPILSFADLQAQTSADLVDKYLLVGYRPFGAVTQTDLVAVIQMELDDAPAGSSDIAITLPPDNAFSDVMITPQVQMLYNSLGGAGLDVFSKSREAVMLADSEPLVEYDPGLTGLAIVNSDKAQHFHLMNTLARPRTANLITTTTAADESIIAVACPLTARFSPFAINLPALRLNTTDNFVRSVNPNAGAGYYFSDFAIGGWFVIQATITVKDLALSPYNTVWAVGSREVPSGASLSRHSTMVIVGGNQLFLGHINGFALRKGIGIMYDFLPNQTYTLQGCYRILNNTNRLLPANQIYDFNNSFVVVNGRKGIEDVSNLSPNIASNGRTTFAASTSAGGGPGGGQTPLTNAFNIHHLGFSKFPSSITTPPLTDRLAREYATGRKSFVHDQEYIFDSITAGNIITPTAGVENLEILGTVIPITNLF